MQIILDQEEAKAYLAETSKSRPKPLTTEQKAEIQRLYHTGMARGQIAKELHLPGRQVSGAVQAYINLAKKLLVEPKIEDLQPIQPLVMPEAKSPLEEFLDDPPKLGAPTCATCSKPLDHDRVAIGGKFYHKACAPKKVPTMITRRPKPPKSNSAIDNLIVDMASEAPIDIANEINRVYGGTWMPDDVTKRLAELRKA